MKISKGMYIRCNGDIDNVFNVILDKNNSNMNRVYTEFGTYFINEIENASFNLINLIKVGDYVNGEKVCNIIKKDKDYCYLMKNSNKYFDDKDIIASCDAYSYQKLIKDIVTKEQFNSCKYVIERDK